jgi:hypothetical protein
MSAIRVSHWLLHSAFLCRFLCGPFLVLVAKGTLSSVTFCWYLGQSTTSCSSVYLEFSMSEWSFLHSQIALTLAAGCDEISCGSQSASSWPLVTYIHTCTFISIRFNIYENFISAILVYIDWLLRVLCVD